MAVKWIKITTGIFDNPKIKYLRKMPGGNDIVLIWIMLLTIAGRCNLGGRIFLTEKIPYDAEMLADLLKFQESFIQIAIKAFEQLDMVHYEGDFLTITGWEEYQNIEGLEKIREQNRIRKQKQREKEKEEKEMSQDKSHNVTGQVTQCHAIDIDIELDIEKEKEKRKRIQYQLFADMYNALCPSLPSLITLSDAHKKSIKARLNKYTEEDFKTLFTKAEASDFLKGANNKDWTASFDWLIKDSNMAKVLNGNYDNKPGKSKQSKSYPGFKQREYDQEAIKRAIHNQQNPPKTAGEDEGIKAKADALKELLGKE